MLSQGSILVSDQPVTINNLKGFLIKTKRQTFEDRFLSHTLIFGDLKTSYVVQSIFSEGDKSLEIVSNRVLLSVVYKPVINFSPSSYSFELNKYSFEFSEVKNGIDYYHSKEGHAGMSISVDYFYTKGNADPGIIFRNRMQRLPFASVELDENGIDEVMINNQGGLQANIIATNEKGDTIYIYQALLSNNEKHYLLQGTSALKENLVLIKNLVKTFKQAN